MLDFEVQRCTRRCAKTERDLQPGETYFSVLLPQGANVVRLDYSADAWEGPPENALGFWKAQMPAADGAKVYWAPNDVMLEYFQRLEGIVDQADVRYVLALLMIRRRILKLETTEKDPAGQETLVVFCPRNETEYRVAVAMPDEARAHQIQTDLGQLLHSPGGPPTGPTPGGEAKTPSPLE